MKIPRTESRFRKIAHKISLMLNDLVGCDELTTVIQKALQSERDATIEKCAEIAKKHMCECCGETGCVNCEDCVAWEILRLRVEK